MQKNYLSIEACDIDKGAGRHPDMVALQHEAWAAYQVHGLPAFKSELWRYAPLSKLCRQSVRMASKGRVDLSRYEAQYPGADVVLCCDGYWFFSDACQKRLAQEGVVLSVMADKGDLIAKELTRYLKDHKEDDFRGISCALLGDALHISVADYKVVARPLFVIYAGDEAGIISSSFMHINMGQESALNFYEIHQNDTAGGIISCDLMDIVVNKGASLKHYRLDAKVSFLCDEGDVKTQAELKAYGVDTLHATLAEDALYYSYKFSFDRKAREHIGRVFLNGERAKAQAHHVALRHDDSYLGSFLGVWHNVKLTESHNTFRGVLDGHAQSSFRGFLEIAPQAQGVAGFQKNDTLLLSDKATIAGKPELKIYADDVKCSHGMTVGAMDEDQVFYLMTRGMARHKAEEMILRGFIGALIDDVTDEAFKLLCEKTLEEKLNERDRHDIL